MVLMFRWEIFLIKSLNISTTQFGFAVSCYAFSAGISGLLTAGFADRYDRKIIAFLLCRIYDLGTFLCGIKLWVSFVDGKNHHRSILVEDCLTIGFAIITDLFDLQHRRGLGSWVLYKWDLLRARSWAYPSVFTVPIKFDWHAPFNDRGIGIHHCVYDL